MLNNKRYATEHSLILVFNRSLKYRIAFHKSFCGVNMYILKTEEYV